MIRLLLLAAIAVLLAPAPQARAYEQRLEGAAPDALWHGYDCPWPARTGRRVDCGVLEVPENRADPDSRGIYLHVRIFRARRDRGLAPVVFLNGGPGQPMDFSDAAGLEGWSGYLEGVMGWTRGRDVILFAQRGITVDGVGMTCAEFGDPRIFLGATERPGPPGDWAANIAQANRDCLRMLARRGYDLEGYSTTESARDVSALRRALGVAEWILYGVSYGTRLGLEILRHDPDGVASAVFDSVFPPNVTGHWTDPGPFDAALSAMFDACVADPSCAAAYPRLEARFEGLLARLAESPVPIHVDDPQGRLPRLHFEIDAITLIDMVFFNLYWIDGIETLPLAIDALDRGDVATFREVLAEPYVFDPLFSDWSYGMQSAVNCNDDFAWYEAASLRRAIERHPRLAPWLSTALVLPICEGWPARPRESGFAEPVESDVPILLLAGRHDPVTPPAHAEAALAHLSRAQLHVVPGASHSVLDAATCAREIVEAFVEDPTGPVPPLCEARDAGFRFRLR